MTRKLIFAFILVAACAVAMPAQAAPPSASFTVNGNISSSCTISGAGGASFGSLIDTSGAFNQSGTALDSSDTHAFCNQGNTQATITHTNLFTGTTPGTGYVNVIPMSAKLTTNLGFTLTDTTSATGTGTSSGTTAKIGSFTSLKVTGTLGSISPNQPVQGSYSATITLTLAPAN